MGESNALATRSGGLSSRLMEKIEEQYTTEYAVDGGDGERVLPLTFCIIYFMAWK